MTNSVAQELVANAIAKNLPTDVSQIITERLAQADKFEYELRTTREQLSDSKAKVGELSDKVVALGAKLDEHAALDQRQLEIEKAARDLETAMLNQKIELMEASQSKMYDHTAMLLRNTDFRRNYWSESRTPHVVQDYNSDGSMVSRVDGEVVMPENKTDITSAE